ncbi:MAG TPA: NepR family anti-sigma factor [Sphingomicrobium sp.]|nr:NepR family anti-sigma factor [Sphingomicrobium sp.]
MDEAPGRRARKGKPGAEPASKAPPGKASPTPSKVSAPPKRKRTARTGDIGRALRSVYDETLREDVPDDFTALLGKLS